jgi:hypothetical protein
MSAAARAPGAQRARNGACGGVRVTHAAERLSGHATCAENTRRKRMTITATKKWTRENIMDLGLEEIIDLWKQCPAAEVTEMIGEFDGRVPVARDPEAQKKLDKSVLFDEEGVHGYWLGKAFWPLSKTTGDGYNRVRRPGGKIENYLRFATEMGTSLIDGKPSLMMYYGAYHNRLTPEDRENDLVDEIRKLADGIYLGLGTRKKSDGSRTGPGHFVLFGPVGEYRRADSPTEELK